MSYPTSSEVAAPQRTQAAHYNTLRSDAVYLGQTSANAVNLLALLQRFSQYVRLAYLATNKVYVPYEGTRPPALMVNGYMLSATANVNSSTVTGAAGMRYVLAQRVAGATTFTMSVSTSQSEGMDQRLIGEFYFDGTNIQQASIKSYELERPGYVYVGADAQKSSSPAQGDLYLATDTGRIYAAFTAGTWTQLGGGMAKIAGSGIQNYASVSATSNVGSYGSWVQVTAATAAAIHLLLLRAVDEASQSGSCSVQIGTGAAGAETVIGEIPAHHVTAYAGMTVTFPAALPVAAGVRVAVRIKRGSTYASGIVLGYCNQADVS